MTVCKSGGRYKLSEGICWKISVDGLRDGYFDKDRKISCPRFRNAFTEAILTIEGYSRFSIFSSTRVDENLVMTVCKSGGSYKLPEGICLKFSVGGPRDGYFDNDKKISCPRSRNAFTGVVLTTAGYS